MSSYYSTEDNASLILVMGITGAGKSYFINKIAGKDVVKTSAKLKSCTQQAVAVPVTIGREKVLLIDTPGFDDSTRSDTEILTEISRILAFQYECGLQLKGVIFLHRITDIKMQGSSLKTLQICRKICGTSALENVILVTTRWGEVDPRTGAEREEELRTDFWKFMLDFDSIMMRYHGDQESAFTIASQLLRKDTVVLELQRELVDKGKNLADTEAGKLVNNDIENVKRELNELAQLRNDLQRDQAKMKLRFQQDIETERKKLEIALSSQYNQQIALQRPIGQEVREDIAREKKKRSGLGKALPFLPACLSFIGLFVGIPPGTFEMFSSWFTDSGIGDALADIFSSF